MADEGEKQGKGFKVEDRRRFSETGEARDSSKTDELRSEEPPRPTADAVLGAAADKTEAQLPEINFSTFIISLLQEKTRGNLDSGEQQLVEDVLYDLRLRYVDAVKRK